jgi:hypothetical protein
MYNHLNLKIFIHIFTVIYWIMIIIIMRGEHFVAHLDGLGGTPVCRGTPVEHHWAKLRCRESIVKWTKKQFLNTCEQITTMNWRINWFHFGSLGWIRGWLFRLRFLPVFLRRWDLKMDRKSPIPNSMRATVYNLLRSLRNEKH